jgi:hypothetical protein
LISQRTVLTVALTALVPLAGTLRAYGCGSDRWPPKVFGDSDVAAIAARAVPSTIEALTRLQAPPSLPYSRRIGPVETSIYSIADVTLTGIQLAPDGDYELFLRDATGHRMLAESPDPNCLHDSPLKERASAAHRALAQRYQPGLVPKPLNEQVSVTGVGFFDFVLNEPGHAPNGIELHPLLDVSFGGKNSVPRRTASTGTSEPFSYAASTSAAPQTLFYTYHESGAISREMDPTASGTLSGQSLSYAGNETGANFGWISATGQPGTTSWPAQTYTIDLNVTAANSNLRITEVKVYRVDASGGPNTSGLALVGDLKTSASLGKAGTLSFSVPGGAQSANATDRIAVKFYVANSSAVSQSFAYQAGAGTLSNMSPAAATAPSPAPAPPSPTPAPAPEPSSEPQTYADSVTALSPVQYFQLDESSGTTVDDESATHADGTYDGRVAFGLQGPLIGQDSSAIGLDAGAFDVGAHLPAPNVTPGSSFSVETWVYPIYDRSYMAVWGSDSARRLLLGQNGLLLSQFSGNFSSKHALSASGWHHVVFVYDASAKEELYYIDGSLDNTAAASSLTFSAPYYLGEYDTSGNYKWHGRLAQHAVYPFALSASQVLAHYHAAGYPPAAPMPAPSPTASPQPDSPCAGYRWSVKVATDAARDAIALTPVQNASIVSLTAIPQPNADNTLPRMQPTETSTYELQNVTLTEIFKSSDYDYHLLLSDGQGHTMIAESPDPACAQGSALFDQLSAVRNTIDTAYPDITTSGIQVNRPVTLEGVAFFDYEPNYATDQSPDGIELHPVVALCFGTGCALPSPGATPSPSPVPSATPASAYASAILTDAPKQYYKLDETGGSIATDSSGSGQNGSYAGAVTFGSAGPLRDESSSAISLAGGSSSAGVSLPNPNAVSGSSYSIEAWIDPNPSSNYMTVWGYDGSHRMLVSSNGLLLTQFGVNFFSKQPLTTGQWHHVVFVYDAGAQQATYYIDGKLDSTATVTNAAAAFTAPYFLGQYDTSSNYKWNGSIAQAAFYPSALSLSQVSAHYAAAGYAPTPAPSATPLPSPSPTPAGTPAPSPSPSPTTSPVPSYSGTIVNDGPLQYLQLEDASGATAADSSGNGQNGSYTGAVTFGAAGPLRGESSTAITLSGGTSSAGVLVPNPNVAAGGSYSLEIWVNPNASPNYMTIWGYNTSHRLLLSSNGLLLTQLSGNFFSHGALARNAWHQVVFVYDASTQTASYYVDGKLDSSAQVPAASAAFTSAYYLGQYDTSTSYKWNGSLGQFAFYRSALSASQIAAHYAAAGY